MGALFVAQVAVGVAPFDLDRAALDPGFLPFGEFIHGHLHAVVFRPAGVHAQQHLGPVLGVCSASPRIDAEHGTLFVVFAAEQALQFPAVQPLAQLVQPVLSFLQQVLIRLQLIKLKGGLGVIDRTAPSGQLRQLGLHLIQTPHLLLGVLLVIPEIGLGRELFEILLPGVQCRDVKDSPGHCPGGQ